MTDNLVAKLVERVEQHTGTPARFGPNGWLCRCPAHDDHTPSLSIRGGDQGQILVHCFAGCSYEAVLAAVGLVAADAWPERPQTAGVPSSHSRILAHQGNRQNRSPSASSTERSPSPARSYPSFNAALGAMIFKRGEPTMQHNYRDQAGHLVGSVLRWDGAAGEKTFRPLSLAGTEWRLCAMPTPRPLYRLAAVAAADVSLDRVWIVEGEKAADLLATFGGIATTTAGGAQAATFSDFTPLAGRSIVVLPDNDRPGEQYAASVVAALAALEPRPEVRVVRLPGLPEGGDVVDFQAARDADSTTLLATLEALAAKESPLDLVAASKEHEAAKGMSNSSLPTPHSPSPLAAPTIWCPRIVSLVDRPRREIQWVWPGRIALGKLTLLIGDPGLGKSMMTLDLAARVTRGFAMPGCDVDPDEISISAAGSVLLVSGEDDIDDTIVPRLAAAEADLSRVQLLDGVFRTNPLTGATHQDQFDLSASLDALRIAIKALTDCRLVIIDPITAYMGACDSHRNSEVRGMLRPLAELAAETNVAVLAVSHLNKNQGGRALYRAMGSLAFTASARTVLAVVPDPGDAERRICVCVKSNIAKSVPGIPFRIHERSASEAGPTLAPVPAVLWQRDSTFETVDALMADADHATQIGASLADAVDWLQTALEAGPRSARDLKSDAENDGIAIRTLWRAKSHLGAVARRESDSEGTATYVWLLPNTEKLGTLGTVGTAGKAELEAGIA